MKYFVTINGKKFEVEVERADSAEAAKKTTEQKVIESTANAAEKFRDASTSEGAGEEDSIQAPLPGTVLTIKVREGQAVKKGDVIFVLEAMKMENEIMAGRDAVVSKILVPAGASVKTGDILALLK